ncbi:MAG: LysR family transcriptional regulator [Mollicutes bacterium]|jgi:DNA-binding transcriptional LysR family regulator|nr:LysR family transcriptional regulator [Mollicutes bacterium]
MNVNYDLLKVFYIVAKNQSISKAAKELNVSQPAVSQSIQNLEKSLAGQLFIRSKKGVTLTEEGKALFTDVNEGMNLIANGLEKFQEMRNLDVGKVRIGANPIISKHILMPYLKKYHDKYPNIEIELVHESTINLLKQLKIGSIDLVVMSVPRKVLVDFEIYGFQDVQDVFIANSKYYEKAKSSSNIHELLKLPIIVEKSPSISRAYFDLLLKSRNLEYPPSMEVDSQDLLIDFVANGFGIGFATQEYIQDELESKKIFIIDVGQIPKRKVGLAISKKGNLSLSAQKLVDLIKEV